MKVLIVASTLPRWQDDAMPAFVLDQAVALRIAHPELEIRILAPHDAGAARHETMRGIPVERFRYFWPPAAARLVYPAILPNLRRSPWLILQVPFLFAAELAAVLRLSRRWRPDVIYSHWVTPQAAVCTLAAALLGIPHVFTSHSSDAEVWRRVPLLGPAIVRAITRRARAFTAVSRRTLAKLQAFFPDGASWSEAAARSRILPMGIDAASLRPLEADARRALRLQLGLQGQRVILFIGRLTAKKGLDVLLEALSMLVRSVPEAVLVIAGDGEERARIGRRSAELALGERVRLVGFVTGERKLAWLQAADVLAVPSIVSGADSEGLPVSLLEGLAVGAVCVATEVSGADDVITHGLNGLLVPQRDAPALAAALVTALRLEPGARENLARQARERALAFDWPAIAEAHYRHLLGGVAVR